MELKANHKQAEVDAEQHDWRDCRFSDLCGLQRGFDITEATRKTGNVPVYSSSGLSYFHNEARLKPPAVITGRKGLLGNVFFVEEPCWPHDTTLWVKDFRGNDPKFVYWFLLHFGLERFDAATSVPTLNRNNLVEIPIILPPTPEQCAIAATLSDVDALLHSLDQLIAKKRAIKQGAMQQLLSGKIRLAGFNGEWKSKQLGDVAKIKTGKRNNEDKVEDGIYPFFVRSQTVERINCYSFDGEAILVPGEGGIGSIIHYIDGKFDYHQRVYKISDFSFEANGKFIYYCMMQTFNKQATRNSVKATVDSLRLPTFLEFEFLAPSLEEQYAIATTLTNLDTEIAALEQKREKTHIIKQGMMQELLTGRIRLL